MPRARVVPVPQFVDKAEGLRWGSDLRERRFRGRRGVCPRLLGVRRELSPFDDTGLLLPSSSAAATTCSPSCTERVTYRSATALLGFRRYGKTSVLQRLAADLTEAAVIIFDEFQQIATVAGGTAVLRAALHHHYENMQPAVRRIRIVRDARHLLRPPPAVPPPGADR